MEVVKDLCNKCAVMQNGKVVEEGSTLDIFSDPKEKLTREFVETSTNVEQTIADVKENIGILRDDEILVQLNYKGASTTEPLINEIYEKFKIKTNILAANIEFIGSTPVGNLIVTFKGSEGSLDNVLTYLKDKDVRIKILGGKDGIL